jgi:hypothetical protein
MSNAHALTAHSAHNTRAYRRIACDSQSNKAFRQLGSCRQLLFGSGGGGGGGSGASGSGDMGTTTAELTAPNGPNSLDLCETPAVVEVTAEYDDMTHGPVLDGQTSESYPHGRPQPFIYANLDHWYRMKIEQVKAEHARFPNDIATNLAALDIFMEDIRRGPCFVFTEAAQTDLDLCNELNGINTDAMFVGDVLGPVPEVDVIMAKRPQGLLNVGDSFRADGGAAFLRS